jgi:periplasmic protein TonB
MSHLITNQQKMNDVVFAGRNKEYGAYAIRSDYGNTVFKSISFMLLGVVSTVSVAYYFSNKNNTDPNLSGQVFIHDSIYVIPFDNEPKEEPKTEEQKKEPNTAPEDKTSGAVESTKIADSVAVSNTTSSIASVAINTSSSTTIEGPGNSGSKGTNTLDSTPTSTAVAIRGDFEVDTAPVFEGGLPALYRFVSSRLKYPEKAYEYGKEGTVYVKFVVDETGKVGSLSLLNTLGYGLEEEALRVVGMIPKFKSPAKVKGEAVQVYYQIPIKFTYK